MEKSLRKAFIISLLTVMVLSLLFHTIGNSIIGALNVYIFRVTDHPSFFVLWLTWPFTWFPWELFIEITNPATSIGLIVMYIGFLVALIGASIMAGIFGGNFSNSLGGWLLTSLVCIISTIAIVFIDPYNISWICLACELDRTVVQLLIFGVVNLLIFGGITLLTVLVKGDYDK
jgi:hypothetical protein